MSGLVQTLVERIGNAIATDTSGSAEKDGERIIRRYTEADPAAREAIDDIFVSLSGWSLKTFIAGEERTEDEL